MTFTRNRRGARLALLWLLTSLAGSVVAESASLRTEHVEASLVSEVAELAPNDSFWIGLRFRIKPGWHTYWRNPGDSGLAASIDWELPEGMVAGDIRWPVPHRYATGHLMNFGYADEVVLLTRMTSWPPVGTGSEVLIAANATWLVCEDICVMEEGRFEMRLPTVPDRSVHDADGRMLIGDFVRMLPEPAKLQARFDATPTSIRLVVPLPQDWRSGASDVWFYPQEFGIIVHAAPQSSEANADGLALTIARGELKNETLRHVRGVLVVRYPDGTSRGLSVDAIPS